MRIKLLQASPSDPQLWRQNLEATSDSGSWSVIFTGPGMHDNLAAVAPKHPNQKYVFFDDELKLPNVLSIKYGQNEGSYLAGALAGLIATDKQSFPLSRASKKVGLVAGQDLPVIEDSRNKLASAISDPEHNRPNQHRRALFLRNRGNEMNVTIHHSDSLLGRVNRSMGLGLRNPRHTAR